MKKHWRKWEISIKKKKKNIDFKFIKMVAKKDVLGGLLLHMLQKEANKQ